MWESTIDNCESAITYHLYAINNYYAISNSDTVNPQISPSRPICKNDFLGVGLFEGGGLLESGGLFKDLGFKHLYKSIYYILKGSQVFIKIVRSTFY